MASEESTGPLLVEGGYETADRAHWIEIDKLPLQMVVRLFAGESQSFATFDRFRHYADVRKAMRVFEGDPPPVAVVDDPIDEFGRPDSDSSGNRTDVILHLYRILRARTERQELVCEEMTENLFNVPAIYWVSLRAAYDLAVKLGFLQVVDSLPLRAIIRELDQLGHRPRSGSRWYPQQIKRILAKAA